MNNLYFTDKTKRPVLIKELKKFIETQNKMSTALGIELIPVNTIKEVLIYKLNSAENPFNKEFKVFDTMKEALNYRDN